MKNELKGVLKKQLQTASKLSQIVCCIFLDWKLILGFCYLLLLLA